MKNDWQRKRDKRVGKTYLVDEVFQGRITFRHVGLSPLEEEANGFWKDLMETFISDIVLALLSYISENERMNIRRRQAEGIAAAKARGVHFGRTKQPLPEGFMDSYTLYIMKELTVTEAAERCGMARSTFFVRARQMMEEQS